MDRTLGISVPHRRQAESHNTSGRQHRWRPNSGCRASLRGWVGRNPDNRHRIGTRSTICRYCPETNPGNSLGRAHRGRFFVTVAVTSPKTAPAVPDRSRPLPDRLPWDGRRGHKISSEGWEDGRNGGGNRSDTVDGGVTDSRGCSITNPTQPKWPSLGPVR